MKAYEIADSLIKYFKHNDDKISITEPAFADKMFMGMWHSLSDIHMDGNHKMMFAYDFLSDLADNNIEYIDSDVISDSTADDVSIYTSDLTSFLCADANNVYYLTEAMREYELKDGFDALSMAEIIARHEVYQAIADFINDIVDEDEEDAE